jgi:hypothetical protein
MMPCVLSSSRKGAGALVSDGLRPTIAHVHEGDAPGAHGGQAVSIAANLTRTSHDCNKPRGGSLNAER